MGRAFFERTRAQRLLLEYDDARSGSFEPLRLVPDDKIVVLGLLTTKSPKRERTADLVDRTKQASLIVPLDRLALSPQCGFASSIIGNRLSVEDQKYKLALLTETAKRIWS